MSKVDEIDALLVGKEYLKSEYIKRGVTMLTKNPFEGKNEINVVFLGGSITEGYRSSSPEKSYAGICSSWFKSYFSHSC